MSIPSLNRLPETTSEDEDFLLAKYFSSVYPFRDTIDSVDRFLDKDIDDIFAARPCLLRDNVYAVIVKKAILKPQTTYNKKLIPDLAILEEHSYCANVLCGIELYENDMLIQSSSKNFLFTQIPIPIYSKYCHKNKEMNTYRSGVQPVDPGAYFIITGKRHVVPLTERQRFNRMSVGNTNDTKPCAFVTNISESPLGTHSTYLYVELDNQVGISMGSSDLFDRPEDEADDVEVYDESNDSKVKVAKRNPSANVLSVSYVIYLLLGAKKKTVKNVVKEFVSKLSDILPIQHRLKCLSLFSHSVDAFQVLDAKDHIDMVATNILVLNEKNAKIRRHLEAALFPNFLSADMKVTMLIGMTARLLQYECNCISKTDTANWANISLVLPGKTLSQRFKVHYKAFSMQLAAALNSVKSKDANRSLTANDIVNIIDQMNPATSKVGTSFVKPFKPPPPSKGKYGSDKNSNKYNKQISIMAAPNNSIDIRDMLSKITNNAQSKSTSFRPRGVEPSSRGYICYYKTTEDDMCGLVKSRAATTLVTHNEDPDETIRVLLEHMEELGSSVVLKDKSDSATIPVFVNSLHIGFTDQAHGYDNIVNLKRFNRLSPYVTIVKTRSVTIDIFTDSGRLMIPCAIVDRDKKELFIYSDPDWRKMSINELISFGFIEYIDAAQSESNDIVLGQTFNSLENVRRDIAYLNDHLELAQNNPTYRNNTECELNSLIKNYPSYVPIHPLAAVSLVTMLIPFQNRCQSCRVSYSAKHSCQTIAVHIAGEFEHSTIYESMTTTRPAVISSAVKLTGMENQISGQSVLAAFIADPLNQEDSMVVNQALIDKGAFRLKNVFIVKHTLDQREKLGIVNDGKLSQYALRYINDNGLPTVGVYVADRDIIIGKRTSHTSADGKTYDVDSSIALESDENGIITEVVTYRLANGSTCVSVRIERYKSLRVGHKVITSHGQKYIISEIRANDRMPRNKVTGEIIDVMFNPGCYTTRMTSGTLLEPLIGSATAIDGKIREMAGHKETDVDELERVLVEGGFEKDMKSYGWETPGVGDIQVKVYRGYTRISTVIHLAEMKIQFRGVGKKHNVTGQAEATKAGSLLSKGQKVSQEEKNQMLKYGSKFLIWERMNLSSDATMVVICSLCSAYATYSQSIKGFKCANCGIAKDFPEVEHMFGKFIKSQTTTYFDNTIASLGIIPKYKYVTAEAYVK